MDTLKNFLTKERMFYALISAVGTFLLFPAFFVGHITPLNSFDVLWLSLDPSWIITLNYANNLDLTWGKEFAFTYGPLGHLATRVGWGTDKYLRLFFDLFVALNFFLLFYYKQSTSKNKILSLFLLIALWFILPYYIGVGISVLLFGFLVFWIIKSFDNDNVLNNIVQIILLVLLFYIKFNTGVISFAVYFLGLLYKLICNKKPVLLVYPVILFVSIYILSIILNVALTEYLISGLEFISGYNDAMILHRPFNLRQALAIIIMFVPGLILAYKFFKMQDMRFKLGIITLIYGISLFVIYKQAYVRADEGHVLDFFKYSFFLIFCTFPFNIKRESHIISILVSSLAITSLFVLYDKLPGHFEIQHKLKKNYITGFTEYTPTYGFNLFPNNNQLPDEIKQKIGNSTVDVFPWNTHMLFENNLNYLPRPVMQSYAAYTPYLADKNFEHYNSGNGPRFVLYDYLSIDSRYALFDDAKTNIVLLRNYNKIAGFHYKGRDMLLLEKKKDAGPVNFVKTDEYAMSISSPLIPKENVYYEVVLYNNLCGKAISVVEHAPEITLEIGIGNQSPVYFRTSRKLLESGLFGTSLIQDIKQYNGVLTAESENIPKIQYYAFRPFKADNFKQKIRVREYKIN
jgi:hypothetical protein